MEWRAAFLTCLVRPITMMRLTTAPSTTVRVKVRLEACGRLRAAAVGREDHQDQEEVEEEPRLDLPRSCGDVGEEAYEAVQDAGEDTV